MDYKAFISYSHAADGKLAPALQSALHRFTKPWYRMRALRVFRDKTSLSADPGLGAAIERALASSEYFILLASPAAARSPWVDREVGWWVQSRSVEKLLIVLTDGEIAWDSAANDFDWQKTTALSTTLRGRFSGEPLYVDLRWAKSEENLSLRHSQFRAAILDVATPLHGKPKDELDGEDVRQHNTTRAVTSAAVVLLLAFAVAAGWAAYLATQQRNEAQRQRGIAQVQQGKAETAQRDEARQRGIAEDRQQEAERQRAIAEERRTIAQARLLATQAEWTRSQRPDLLARSILLGIEALRRLPSVEADQALRSGLNVLPRQLARLSHTDDVVGVAFRSDGKVLASTLRTNAVRLWDVDSGKPLAPPIRYSEAHGPVSAAVLSRDFRLLAAAARDLHVRVWRTADAAEAFAPLRHERPVGALAFSPDGGLLATATDKVAQVWNAASGARVAVIDLSDGLSGGITAVAFSPDGKLLAMAWRDSAGVWEAATGRPVHTVRTQGAVTALSWSPDSGRLATGSAMSTVSVWTAADGKLGATMVHPGRVTSLAFSPSGKNLAMAGGEESARVWNLVEGRQIAAMPHAGTVSAVAFSPDGEYLATAGADSTARLWEVVTGREVARMVHGARVAAVAFSPDGRSLATASADDTARLWDASGAAEGVAMLVDAASAVAFEPEGRHVAVANRDGAVSVWDTTRRTLSRLTVDGSIAASVLSANGRAFATVLTRAASADSSVQVRALPAGNQIAFLKHEAVQDWDAIVKGEQARGTSYRVYTPAIDRMKREGSVTVAGFSPDGRHLVTTAVDGADRVARVWQVKDARAVARVGYAYHGDVQAMFSAHGRYLALVISTGRESAVRVFDLSTGREVDAMRRPGHRSAVLSPDGGYLATVTTDAGGRDQEITVWKTASGEKLSVIPRHDGGHLVFSPDGRYLVTRDVARAAHVWDSASGRAVPHLRDPGDGPVAFSANGRYVATARKEHEAGQWAVTVRDLTTGVSVASLAHEGQLNGLALSPAGEVLVTAGSEDNAARVWDTRTGREVARMMLESPVMAVAFTPDGRYVVTRDGGNAARVWSWRPKDLIDVACARLTRNLTAAEWSRYFGDEPYHKTCTSLSG